MTAPSRTRTRPAAQADGDPARLPLDSKATTDVFLWTPDDCCNSVGERSCGESRTGAAADWLAAPAGDPTVLEDRGNAPAGAPAPLGPAGFDGSEPPEETIRPEELDGDRGIGDESEGRCIQSVPRSCCINRIKGLCNETYTQKSANDFELRKAIRRRSPARGCLSTSSYRTVLRFSILLLRLQAGYRTERRGPAVLAASRNGTPQPQDRFDDSGGRENLAVSCWTRSAVPPIPQQAPSTGARHGSAESSLEIGVKAPSAAELANPPHVQAVGHARGPRLTRQPGLCIGQASR